MTTTPRILIAGIGNIFFGDDAFGTRVAQQLLLENNLPPTVRVKDLGIRSLDLTYTLLEPWELVILIDAMPRNNPPGTLVLFEPELPKNPDDANLCLDGHSLDPVRSLLLARSLGPIPPRVLVLGCEPADITPDNDTLTAEVQAAMPRALDMIRELIEQHINNDSEESHVHQVA
jgi:hydrogenase maturation protease